MTFLQPEFRKQFQSKPPTYPAIISRAPEIIGYRGPENPNVTIDAHVNLTGVCFWCVISSEGILGPFFFDRTVTAQNYLAMLEHQLLLLLQQHNEAENLYFQQDGAPAQYATLVRDWLDANLPGRWISRRRLLEWPSPSPDLTPLDFSL